MSTYSYITWVNVLISHGYILLYNMSAYSYITWVHILISHGYIFLHRMSTYAYIACVHILSSQGHSRAYVMLIPLSMYNMCEGSLRSNGLLV